MPGLKRLCEPPALPRLPGKATTTRQPKAKRSTKEHPKCTQNVHFAPLNASNCAPDCTDMPPYLTPLFCPCDPRTPRSLFLLENGLQR